MGFRRDCSFGPNGTRCLFASCYNCEVVDSSEEEFQKPPGDYEPCRCGWDHNYDGINPDVQKKIEAFHLAEEHEKGISPESLEMLHAGIESGKNEPSVYLGSFTNDEEKKPVRPRYWLEEPSSPFGGFVFVMVAIQIPGDADFPLSWKRGLCPHNDRQLEAAETACLSLCNFGHHTRSEETSDAIWHGFEFFIFPSSHEEVSAWDQVKEKMTLLLGEPGQRPEF